jgi:hypothetical protein
MTASAKTFVHKAILQKVQPARALFSTAHRIYLRHTVRLSRFPRLLRQGTVEFVVADVGQKLRWIAPTDCYEYWKAEVKSHLAAGESRIVLDNFPDAYCYIASEWGTAESASSIVVLERYH